MYQIISKNTGKTYEEVAQACERDNYLTPEEAKEFGLVDDIIESIPKAYQEEE